MCMSAVSGCLSDHAYVKMGSMNGLYTGVMCATGHGAVSNVPFVYWSDVCRRSRRVTV